MLVAAFKPPQSSKASGEGKCLRPSFLRSVSFAPFARYLTGLMLGEAGDLAV
jgi:hypothetical protein